MAFIPATCITQYKCPFCGDVFTGYKEAAEHSKTHPESFDIKQVADWDKALNVPSTLHVKVDNDELYEYTLMKKLEKAVDEQ